jgi:hypothetical protein
MRPLVKDVKAEQGMKKKHVHYLDHKQKQVTKRMYKWTVSILVHLRADVGDPC